MSATMTITTDQERFLTTSDASRFYPINDVCRLCVVYADGSAVTIDTTGRRYSAQRPFPVGNVAQHNEAMQRSSIQPWRMVEVAPKL